MRRHWLVVAPLLLAIGVPILAQRGSGSGTAAALVPKAVTTVEAKHLFARAGVSDTTTVAPGGRITLILDITPKQTIHVYAPGQEGYLAIAIAIESQPAFTLAATTYPAAKRMFFEGLQQTLSVYDAPFRLTRDVTFTVVAHGSVTLIGTLDYQACDDTVCYRTDQAPLKWTISVK